jgi:hypothetical protein
MSLSNLPLSKLPTLGWTSPTLVGYQYRGSSIEDRNSFRRYVRFTGQCVVRINGENRETGWRSLSVTVVRVTLVTPTRDFWQRSLNGIPPICSAAQPASILSASSSIIRWRRGITRKRIGVNQYTTTNATVKCSKFLIESDSLASFSYWNLCLPISGWRHSVE